MRLFKNMTCHATAVGTATFLMSATFAWAQSGTASISGRVTDQQGAVLPGATVSVTNLATASARTVVTNASGLYQLIALPPGTYEMTVAMSGFRTVTFEKLELRVDMQAQRDVELQVAMAEALTIRAGIESAIAAKRESTSIVEAVTSEDIGKLPDISIAESVARLPGLAAQRVDGAAQVISVRGLAPDFATTLLNGREQVSTGDNRGVEYDQYPSELINRVLVQKTPDASLVGQGLSGTLGLETVSPLSFGNRVLALNLRGERGTLDELGSDSRSTGNRISGAYLDQFAGNTLGIAIGYARLASPIASAEFGTFGWRTITRAGVPVGTSNTAGLKTSARSGRNTRDGLIGVVEWRPSTRWATVVDAYYSKFRREQTNRGIETRLDQNGGNTPNALFTATTIVDNSLLGATVANVYPAVRNIYNDRVDKLTALGWNGKYRGGKWSVTGDISYSRAERDELNLETQAAQRDAGNKAILDTVTYDLTSGGFPTVAYGRNYADPTTVKIGPTIFNAGYGKVPQINDTLNSYKLTVSRRLDWLFDNVELGFNYGDRTKRKDQPEARLTERTIGQFLPVAGGALLADTRLGFAGVPASLSWEVPTLLALGQNFLPFTPGNGISTGPGLAAALVQKRWAVDEKILSSYVQFNLDRHIGSVRMRGNIGAQVKAVDQSSSADYFDRTERAGPAQIKQRTDGSTYTDVLPSTNLAFEFPHQQVLRLAAAKQVARPRLDQMRASFDFNIVSGEPSGSGGNPRLDPWRANAFDISYEKYFAKEGYVAVAGFYKDLKKYILDLTTEGFDFSEFTAGNPLALTNFGRLRQPLNGKGGVLKGVEFSLSMPLNMLADALDGFGFVGSLSRNSSAITVGSTNEGVSIPLPGLSKTVSNLTAYYDKKGFSARASRRWRSDFVGEITAFANQRALRFVTGEAVVDVQVGYTFQQGPLKGLGILFQASNVTDSAYRTYRQTHGQIEELERYGRSYLLGAKYRF